MSTLDWKRRMREAATRLRDHYHAIGLATGAPFLGVLYPPALEVAVLTEWRTQLGALGPDYEFVEVDALKSTQHVLATIGTSHIVESLADPMPGSDPQSDLAREWIRALVQDVHEAHAGARAQRPVVTITRLAALYPAAGPRAVMQELWDSDQAVLKRPVVLLIPGSHRGTRSYSFLDLREELMYRGDLL
jgi:hypothetical protein